MNQFRKSIHHPLHKRLRQLLISARMDLGLTQRDVAEKMNVTHSLIGKIETGDRRLDVVELIEYLKVLNLDIYSILEQLQEN